MREMNWMGVMILIALYICSGIFMFLLLGYGGFIWIGAMTILYICVIITRIAYRIKYGKPNNGNNINESTFTDDDFINCKVGEWVSRK